VGGEEREGEEAWLAIAVGPRWPFEQASAAATQWARVYTP
jgi:hypothetical protein